MLLNVWACLCAEDLCGSGSICLAKLGVSDILRLWLTPLRGDDCCVCLWKSLFNNCLVDLGAIEMWSSAPRSSHESSRGTSLIFLDRFDWLAALPPPPLDLPASASFLILAVLLPFFLTSVALPYLSFRMPVALEHLCLLLLLRALARWLKSIDELSLRRFCWGTGVCPGCLQLSCWLWAVAQQNGWIPGILVKDSLMFLLMYWANLTVS